MLLLTDAQRFSSAKVKATSSSEESSSSIQSEELLADLKEKVLSPLHVLTSICCSMCYVY